MKGSAQTKINRETERRKRRGGHRKKKKRRSEAKIKETAKTIAAAMIILSFCCFLSSPLVSLIIGTSYSTPPPPPSSSVAERGGDRCEEGYAVLSDSEARTLTLAPRCCPAKAITPPLLLSLLPVYRFFSPPHCLLSWPLVASTSSLAVCVAVTEV